MQFPKLSLNFKKIYLPKYPEIDLQISNEVTSNFSKLIPDTISKKISRIQRLQNKHNSSGINLRDGSQLKLASLLNTKTKSSSYNLTSACNQDQDQSNSGYALRKLRIAANIHSQLINFFSSGFIPKILRSDVALWSMINISVTDSLERVDIEWKLSSETNSEQYLEPISSCLLKLTGPIRHYLADKINLKTTPNINFIFLSQIGNL